MVKFNFNNDVLGCNLIILILNGICKKGYLRMGNWISIPIRGDGSKETIPPILDLIYIESSASAWEPNRLSVLASITANSSASSA